MESLFSSNWMVGGIIAIVALLWFVRMGTKMVFGIVKAVIFGVIAFALYKYFK